MRRRLYVTSTAFLKAHISKATAVDVKHATIDQQGSPLTSAAASPSSLYDLNINFSISRDQTTDYPTDAHHVPLVDVAALPLNSDMTYPFKALYQHHLINSPVIDEPFYSPMASPLTDVDQSHSLLSTPSSYDDEGLHLTFATPPADVDEFESPSTTPLTEFYSPSVPPLVDVEEFFYSPSVTCFSDDELSCSPLSTLLAGESYCTPLPSWASSSFGGSLVNELTPYFSLDSDPVAAKTPIVSAGIGLGILVPASTPENEDTEFLVFNTPLSSVITLDEYDRDEHRSPVVAPILDFIGELVSAQMTEALTQIVKAAGVPLLDSPFEYGNIPLPDSPIEDTDASATALPRSPIGCSASLHCSPVGHITLAGVDSVSLPNIPLEHGEAVGSQFVVPRASPVLSVASSESSPVLYFMMSPSPYVSCSHEALDRLAQDLANFSLRDVPSVVTTVSSVVEERVTLEYVLPRSSPALSVTSSSSSPMTRFTIPASPVYPLPYVVFSHHVENLDLEKASMASPHVDMITAGFAGIVFDGSDRNTATSATDEPEAGPQVRSCPSLREVD